MLISILGQGWFQASLAMTLFVAAAIFSLVLYKKSRKLSALTCAVVHTAILGFRNEGFTDDLEVRFKNVIVPRISATVIAFWNTGNETILGSQIVKSDKLRAELLNDCKILQVEIIDKSRNVVDPFIIIDKNTCSADIGFDFLDPNDGFVIQIVHSSKREDFLVNGTIRGIPNGLSFIVRRRKMITRLISFLAGAFVGILSIMISNFFGDISAHVTTKKIAPAPADGHIFLALIIGIIVLIPTLGLTAYLNKMMKSKFPQFLRSNPHLSATLF